MTSFAVSCAGRHLDLPPHSRRHPCVSSSLRSQFPRRHLLRCGRFNSRLPPAIRLALLFLLLFGLRFEFIRILRKASVDPSKIKILAIVTVIVSLPSLLLDDGKL